MSEIKAELWSPDILERGYIISDGKRVYIKEKYHRSNEFKRILEGLSKELKRRMIKLSPLQKKCLTLYYLSQKPITQEEIAKKLGIARVTVKEHLKRAIKKLKEE